jgi:hypothetical protein
LDLQEKLYGKPITVADREMVEEKVDSVLSEATSFDVAFLVVGDPFGYVPVGFRFNFVFYDCKACILAQLFIYLETQGYNSH